MDWEQITRDWVNDGLIQEDQREPLRDRLRALPAPSTGVGLATGPLVTVIIAPAAWLLVGAAVALLFALASPSHETLDALVGGAALLYAGAGGVLRFVPSVRPIGRGLLAAAVPLFVYVLGTTLEHLGVLRATLPILVLPPLLSWVLGLLENSRAITATAAICLVATAATALADTNHWLQLLVSGASGYAWLPKLITAALCLLGLAGLAGASRALPTRAGSLAAGTPALVILGVGCLIATDTLLGPLWNTVGANKPWAFEKGLFTLGFGAIGFAIGLVSRSGFTLVPAVGCMAAAAVWMAFEIGSFIGGAVALAAVSAALFVTAVALWVRPLLQRA